MVKAGRRPSEKRSGAEPRSAPLTIRPPRAITWLRSARSRPAWQTNRSRQYFSNLLHDGRPLERVWQKLDIGNYMVFVSYGVSTYTSSLLATES